MKNLLVTIGLCAFLTAETHAAGNDRACKQENGRFTYDHPINGKLSDLTKLGLDYMRAEEGESATTEEQMRECPKAKISVVDALKDWFKQFTEQETELSTENTQTSKHTAKKGDFEAILLMTQNSDFILANSHSLINEFEELVSINVGEGIEALLLFRGCSSNPNGDCLVTADYSIKSPDGSTYLESLNTDVWKENVSTLQEYKLTNTRVGFVLTSDLEAGLYEVEVTVTDKISDANLSLSGKVLVNALLPEENSNF